MNRILPDILEKVAVHQDPRRPPNFINWSVLQLQGSPPFVMVDPFRSYVQESRDYQGQRGGSRGVSLGGRKRSTLEAGTPCYMWRGG